MDYDEIEFNPIGNIFIGTEVKVNQVFCFMKIYLKKDIFYIINYEK